MSETTINRRDWLAATAATALTACTNASAQSPNAGKTTESIDELLKLASVPGLGMATVRGADVSVEGFGVRRAGGTDRVTGDTVFEAASLSKPVFATIVMQLVGEGKIDLTRPLVEYMPLPNPNDERSKRITATHALSHSGGWRNWRNNLQTALTADFEPGERFSYSGEGYF